MRFAVTLVITFLLVFLAYPATNFVLDKYGVFQTPKQGQVTVYNEPNKMFLKTDYVLKHPDKFDSFVFGSSRVGLLDVTKMPGGKFYNMAYSEGLPKEHLENIKLLLKHGIKIKNIIIGLDDFTYRISPDKHKDEPLRLAHYETSLNDRNWFTHYWYYLFLKIKWEDLSRYSQRYYQEMFNTGTTQPSEDYERRIDSDIDTYRKDPKFRQFSHTYVPTERTEQTLNELSEIIEICKKNNIKLIFLINPIHHFTYNRTDIAHFLDFKRQLAGITDYWDFSGLNSITLDNGQFYETSHYRLRVGDMILSKIFGDGSKAPADFGHLVTKDNFPLHRARLIKELNAKGRRVYECDSCDSAKGQELINLDNLVKLGDFQGKIDFSKGKSGTLALKVVDDDPSLMIKPINGVEGLACLCLEMDCGRPTRFQIFYLPSNKDNYNEANSFTKQLIQGKNDFCLMIPSRFVENGLRLDLVSDPGEYEIHSFSLRCF